MFSVEGKVVVITGGYGVLGASMARSLAAHGARVVIVGRRAEKGKALVAELEQTGAEALFCQADVLDREALVAAREAVVERWGSVDVLINAAGGNMPGATIMPDKSFIDIDFSAFGDVVNLNLMGTVIPTVIFGEQMAAQKRGSIINISSMTAQRVVTRVVGYSASKSAIDNFTRWMAVEMAKKVGEGVRVNAIAPGFFLTEQNRALMTNEDGSLSARAQDVVRVTPFGRLGEAEELHGAVIFYASDASRFVTGTVLPVDGGFSIFSGV